MTAIVSLQEASAHLRRDDCDGDSLDLSLKIDAASEAVMQYLKWTEADVPDPVPFLVKAAVLCLVGEMYSNREGEISDPIEAQYGYGYLPKSVVSLLYPLRMPSIA